MHWWGTDIIARYDSIKPGLGPIALAAWFGWIILSITLHELSHGWAAISCGDDTPRELEHMTLNPVKHMGLTSLVLLAATGLCWGAMPVNPNRFRGAIDDAIVAAAGPMMNVLIAAVAWAGAVVSWKYLGADHAVCIVFMIGLLLNLSLAIMNLIPIPPLDGSRIVAGFIHPLRPFVYSPQGAMIGLILIIVMSQSFGGLIGAKATQMAFAAIDAGLKLLGTP